LSALYRFPFLCHVICFADSSIMYSRWRRRLAAGAGSCRTEAGALLLFSFSFSSSSPSPPPLLLLWRVAAGGGLPSARGRGWLARTTDGGRRRGHGVLVCVGGRVCVCVWRGCRRPKSKVHLCLVRRSLVAEKSGL
jgi:hypothetical protein